MVITKEQLRRNLRQLRMAKIGELEAAYYCKLMLAQLFNIIESKTLVSGYWPHGSELDCRPLLYELHSRGYPLSLPRATANTKLLSFYSWTPETLLVKDDLGILAPFETEQVIPHYLLVPLLGFDKNGHRLGQGLGCYDRTLKDIRHKGGCIAIGLAFEWQLVDKLPIGPDDESLDYVITPEKTYRFLK